MINVRHIVHPADLAGKSFIVEAAVTFHRHGINSHVLYALVIVGLHIERIESACIARIDLCLKGGILRKNLDSILRDVAALHIGAFKYDNVSGFGINISF